MLDGEELVTSKTIGQALRSQKPDAARDPARPQSIVGFGGIQYAPPIR